MKNDPPLSVSRDCECDDASQRLVLKVTRPVQPFVWGIVSVTTVSGATKNSLACNEAKIQS